MLGLGVCYMCLYMCDYLKLCLICRFNDHYFVFFKFLSLLELYFVPLSCFLFFPELYASDEEDPGEVYILEGLADLSIVLV